MLIKIMAMFPLLFFLGSCTGGNSENDDFTEKRNRMVHSQIEVRGIRDARVIEAMRKVPRHLFVPEEERDSAYDDFPLPIGEGQTVSQPYIVAFMTEALKIKKTDKVLEIGTGSGYQSAVLCELAGEVYSIEIIPELAEKARNILEKTGYTNIHVKTGDGWLGWQENAPYDKIIVTAAPTEIPEALVNQLKEGGQIIVPVGEKFGTQSLILGTKKEGKLKKTPLLAVRFVPMVKEKEK